MISPNTIYDSQEKNWVRQHLWIPSLLKIDGKRKKLKLLEMLGESPEVWWESPELILRNSKLEIFGITLDNNSKQSIKCGQIFQGKLSRLLNDPNFTKSFPYQVINLDYYGGGRWFNDKYVYPKITEVLKIIEMNMKKSSESTLFLTLDLNDKIFPWYKTNGNIILHNQIFLKIKEFMNKIENLDNWNIWMALFGNAFEICQYCQEHNLSCKFINPPFTYIGESKSHKSRMLAYVVRFSRLGISQRKQALFIKTFEQIKKTKFVKWNPAKQAVNFIPPLF